MFDPKQAMDTLISDRHDYLLKVKAFLDKFLDDGNDVMAAETIVNAAISLAKVTGTIEYLDVIKDEDYPRFNTILN